MGMFSTPRYSRWRIAGSAGGTVQLETPVVNLSAGVGYLWLPLDNTVTGEKISVHMAGGGVGFGVGESIFGVVDVEGSLPSFPSDGIGRVVAGFRAPTIISRSDFTGNRVMAMGLGGKIGTGYSLVCLLFMANGWERIVSTLIPGNGDDIVLCQFGGLFHGMCMGSGASAGVSYYEYQVVSVVKR